MPFTLSHPAAVIPLRKLGVFSALIIGSMMPDTVYFLPFFSEHDRFGHTLPGLFFYCLPAGLTLVWLFHRFMKQPFISLFPRHHQGRLTAASPGFQFTPSKRLLLILWSVLIGSVTHILWDSLTHTDTYLFTTSGWLSEPVHTGGPKLQVADVLQLGSSLFGLTVIALCYWLWLKRTPEVKAPAQHLPNAARISVFAALAASAAVPFMVRLLLDPELWFRAKRRTLVSFGIVNGIKLICVEIFIFCLIWHLVFRHRENAESPVSHSY
jgi:hypothetical protein